MGANTAWAQATYNHSYTEGVTVAAGGDYFLYNIEAKQFLTNGLSWGTHATVDNSGRVLTLTASDTGYKIYTNYVSLNNRTESKEGYLFSDANGVWTDNTAIDDVWYFESVSIAGYTNAYTIKKDASTYLQFNSSDFNVNVGSNTEDNSSYWLLISKPTREAAGDYSHYLINTQMNCPWEWKTWCGSTTNTNEYLFNDGNASNYVGDKAWAVYDVFQDVKESLPNGKYKVYAQTSYSSGESDATPVLYANSETHAVTLWDATTDGERTTGNASTAYSAGKYTNEVTTIVTNNTLQVGVRMSVATQWILFDNFVLDYLGTCLVNDAVAFTNGATMAADTWYYYDVPYSISYTVAAGSDLSAVAYSTDGTQLTASATTSSFSNPQTLTAGRYYFKSSSAQTLTFTPADYATDRTEEVYDFASANSTNTSSQCGYGDNITINGNTDGRILSSEKLEMKDRFAGVVVNSSTWNVFRSGNGLGASADRNFAILNLSEGDYVTITYSGSGPTFIGNSNIAGQANGTVVASATVYKMTSSGNLELQVPKAASSSWTYIKSIKISTSAPVLNAPTITFNNMVESEGLYYPQVILASEDGVTFKNGSDETITSPYTFTSAGTLTVYATKAGRTNSAKATYTVTDAQVGMIKANSVNASSLTGTVNYGTGSTFEYGNSAEGTWVIPGLSFGTNFYNYTTRITQTGGTRSLTCTVLNENRVATINHYYYESNKTINDFLTSTNSSATFHRSGSSYDHFYQYDLFVSPSEQVSVTIGTTGYSTFSSPVPLNFAGIDGLTAYVAKEVADGSVKLTSVNSAPANTGLVLKGTASTQYDIPVTASAATPESNMLVGCIVETTVAADATSGFNNYVLAIEDGEAKFQSLVENGATIPAGKAFLKNGAYSAGGGARALNIVFGDESTGISTVNGSQSKANGEYHNLGGQRVTAPQKGLYIVNGKKVVVK